MAKQLSDQHMLSLANMLCDTAVVYKLFTQLGLPLHSISLMITNYPNNLAAASRELLFKWLYERMGGDREQAYICLYNTLVQQGMAQVAKEALDTTPGHVSFQRRRKTRILKSKCNLSALPSLLLNRMVHVWFLDIFLCCHTFSVQEDSCCDGIRDTEHYYQLLLGREIR